MTEILDTMDFLDRGRHLLKAARMAAPGASGLDSDKKGDARLHPGCCRRCPRQRLQLDKMRALPTLDKQAIIESVG
jgi:hypothetical protein